MSGRFRDDLRSFLRGDPGTSRFYLSLEDDLLRIFGAERITGLMERLGMEEDVPIEHLMVNRAIENAQRKVEAHHFDSRKHLLEYDDVMNQQRKSIYALRRQILEGRLTGFDVEDILKGKMPATIAKSAEDSDDEGSTPQAVSAEAVRDEYAGLSKRLRPIMSAIVNHFLDSGSPEASQDDEEAEASADEEADTTAYSGKLRDPQALTHELYRRFGSVIEFEKASESKKALLDRVVHETAVSMIQQRKRVYDLAYELVEKLVVEHCPEDRPSDDWDMNALVAAAKEQFNLTVSVSDGNPDPAGIADHIWEQVEKFTQAREEELGMAFLYFARHFWLEEIDKQWIDHLKAMDGLREGIGLRGYGQRDPKQEYKKEGYSMFMQMMDSISQNVAQQLFRVRLDRQEVAQTAQAVPEAKLPEFRHKQRRILLQHASSSTSGAEDEKSTRDAARDDQSEQQGGELPAKGNKQPSRRDESKTGRNEPCPCGSGKKYKKCHGATAAG